MPFSAFGIFIYKNRKAAQQRCSAVPQKLFPRLARQEKSKKISYFENKLFGLFPAEAWVCDGLAVDMLIYLLVAVLDVAFDHEALDKLADVLVVAAVVENLVDDTWLFERMLA